MAGENETSPATETAETLKAKLAESEARVNKILSDHETEKTTWAQAKTKLEAELTKQAGITAELADLKTHLSEKSSLLTAAQGQIAELQEKIKALTPPQGVKLEEGAGDPSAPPVNEKPQKRYRMV